MSHISLLGLEQAPTSPIATSRMSSTKQASKGLSNRPPLAELDLNIPGDYSSRPHQKRAMRETRSRIPNKTPNRLPRRSSNTSLTQYPSAVKLCRRYTAIREGMGAGIGSPRSSESSISLPAPYVHEEEDKENSDPSKPEESLLHVPSPSQDEEGGIKLNESPLDLLTLSQLGDSSSSPASSATHPLSGNFNFHVSPMPPYFKTPSITSHNYTASGNESGISVTIESHSKEEISPATIVIIESPSTTSPSETDRVPPRKSDTTPPTANKSPEPTSPVITTPVAVSARVVPVVKPSIPSRQPSDFVDFRASAASARTTASTPCCNGSALRGTVWIRRGRHPFSRWRRCAAWIVNDTILTWLPHRSHRQGSLNLAGVNVLDLGVTQINDEPAHVLQLRTTKPTTIHNVAVTTLADHEAWCSELKRCSRAS